MNKKAKKLNQQNNCLDRRILPENQEIFTNMICYLRGADISDYEIERVRQDLTEMVLSAQKRGEPITALFDGDYKQFCDDVIEALPPRTRWEKALDALDTMCWTGSILIAINIVLSRETFAMIAALLRKDPVNWNLAVSVGSVLSIFLILALANFLVKQIIKNAFCKEDGQKRAGVFFCAAGFVLSIGAIAWLGTATLFEINFFIACAAAIALFGIHKALESA